VAYVALAVAAGAVAGLTAIPALERRVDHAHACASELAATIARRDRTVRQLEDTITSLGGELARERRREAAEHERILAEIARLRAQDAARTSEHLASVESRVQFLRELADRSALEASSRRLDEKLVHRELVQPTVRVNAKSEVGSGSLIYSRAHKGQPRTFVLTAWHIVKDNVGEGGPTPIDVDVYDALSKPTEFRGKLVAREEALDLALLELHAETVFPVTARLPRTQDLERVSVFAKVYAIGCPLGYAPMPTSGELTSTAKELDGVTYWMTNAPTIFGNSGGGIYLADSRHLVGVLSRISAYKNLIDVAVPHMGIVTPFTRVYEWLEKTEFAFIPREMLAPETAVLNASHSTGGR
jgi:S1-C subfamily serine protease